MEAGTILQMEQSLRNLGLSQYEVKVIAYLFRTRRATSKEISKNLALPFNMVQLATSNLTRRGLLRVSTDQNKAFIICSTKEFKLWIQSEKNKHSQIYDQAEEDLDGFFKHIEGISWQPQVLYYEGVEGIKEIYEDIIETEEDIYCCTDLVKIIDLLGANYMNNFIEKRNDKKINLYVIRPENSDKILCEKNIIDDDLRHVKIMKDFKLNGEIRVYGDKIAFINFEDNNPVGFIIKGGSSARLFQQLFKSYWEKI